MGRAMPGSPFPARSHPSPFPGSSPASCAAFCFQLWALILSSRCKSWHMEGDTPKGRESISLTPVANGLENMGADLLESLVCPLPHPVLAPGWEDPLFTFFLHPLYLFA